MELLTSPRSNDLKRQQGVILLMTLVMMLIMTLSALAMMFLMRSGVSSSGNIAFRQAAVRVTDVAVENAFQWILSQTNGSATALDASSPTNGYFAIFSEASATCAPTSPVDPLDVAATRRLFNPTAYDFTNSNCAKHLSSTVSGYDLYYVVHRMASSAGSCPTAGCTPPSLPPVAATPCPGCSQDVGSNTGSSGTTSMSANAVLYRVTVKVVGPRRNNRYIQAYVY